MTSKAYLDGYADGLAWDLDGYDDANEIKPHGWDDATINAMGTAACAKAWGVPAEGPDWEQACAKYNAGAYAGATSPQDQRTGLPPRAECD